MYERFSDRNRQVMRLANQEAQRLHHEYIGTEHILLGLIRVPDSTALEVLKSFNVEPHQVRAEVEKLVQSGPDMITMGKFPHTARAKKIIEYAMVEVRSLGHDYVGTEHILLALLREGEGVAAIVLEHLGLSLEGTRARVLEILQHRELAPEIKPQGAQHESLESTNVEHAVSASLIDDVSERARKALRLAREEAVGRNQTYIGTEHLLLGLEKEGSGVAAQVLKSYGADLDGVAQEVASTLVSEPTSDSKREPKLTPLAKNVLAYMFAEARGLQHHVVGTEHLLLGLLRETEGVAARILTRLGMNLEDVRTRVVEILNRGMVNRVAATLRQTLPLADSPADPPATGSLPTYAQMTDRARKVIQLADQEAQRFNHEYIGTEHILLGLVKEGSGVAAKVLKNFNVHLRRIRLEVEKLIQSGPGLVTMGRLLHTPRAKKIIEYAFAEAQALNHNYVGTEHILLGLLRDRETVATQVLMNLGLKLEDVREDVLHVLAGGLVRPSTVDPVHSTHTEISMSQAEPLTKRSSITPWLALAVIALLVVIYLTVRPMTQTGTSGESHPAVGMPLAKWQLTSLDSPGETISEADVKGQVVVMSFWGTWCPPCREELPHLAELAARHTGDKRFRLLPISYPDNPRETPERLQTETLAYLKNANLSIPAYADSNGMTREAAKVAGAFDDAFPTTVVLDAKGVIRGVWQGYAPGVENQVSHLVDKLMAGESGETPSPVRN